MLLLDTVNFVSELWALSPIVGILAIACIYLARELHNKNGELKCLNEYIRNSEKENLQILQKVNNTLDKVSEAQKSGDDFVLKDIGITKDSILKEIDNLKDLILLKLQDKK